MDLHSEDRIVNALVDAPEGSLLIDWIIVAKYAERDSSTMLVQSCSETMDMVTQLGLAEAARDFAIRRLRGEMEPE